MDDFITLYVRQLKQTAKNITNLNNKHPRSKHYPLPFTSVNGYNDDFSRKVLQAPAIHKMYIPHRQLGRHLLKGKHHPKNFDQ